MKLQTTNEEIKSNFSKIVKIGCYSFTIRNTKQSSAVFGNCEICNKPASEVWHQKRMTGNSVISDGYGHKECLEKIRSRSAE